MKRLLLTAMTALLLSAGSAGAGPYEDATAAYDRGDYATVLRILRPLAVRGDAEAQYNLGAMYDKGQGVARDYGEAVKWYRLAAAQGDMEAQNNLGEMYRQGQGVKQDYVRAYMWLNLSAVSGYANAGKGRDAAAKRMTPQQIAEAQKLGRECQQRKFKGCD